jgi:signal transduction histidine kinase
MDDKNKININSDELHKFTLEKSLMQYLFHDIESNLQSLMNYSDVLYHRLLEEKPDIDKLKHITKNIISNIELLRNTIQNHRVLNFEEKHSPINLGLVIRRIIGSLQLLAEQRKLFIKYRSDVKEEPIISGSERSIGLVIYNIILNDIKYSTYSPKSEQPISVVLSKSENYYVTSIINYGVPINELEKELIFKAGYRGSTSFQNRSPGVGFGLYISNEIIKKHNGIIELKNKFLENDINMTEFLIRIPIISNVEE